MTVKEAPNPPQLIPFVRMLHQSVLTKCCVRVVTVHQECLTGFFLRKTRQPCGAPEGDLGYPGELMMIFSHIALND